MQLHRALIADWSDVKPADWNHWQRWAARSAGYATPGNATTIAGLLLVVAGLYLLASDHGLWWATVLVLAGRVADLLDGIVADKTGTKSPVGEAMDAGVDKLIMVITVPVLWLVGALPLIAFILIVIHTVAIIVLFALSRPLGEKLHPSRTGKLAAFAEWGLLLLFIAAYAVSHTVSGPLYLIIPAYVLLAVFTYCGLNSGTRYAQQLLKRRG